MAMQSTHLKIKTTDGALSMLEKSLFGKFGKPKVRQRHIPSGLQGRLSVAIVDERGRELKLEDLPLAYLALVYTGGLDKIREIQTALREKAEAKGYEFSEAAAFSGYSHISQQYLEGIKTAKFLQLDALLSDFGLVEQVTGVTPQNDVHYAVLEEIPALEDSPRLSSGRIRMMMVKYLKYMNEKEVKINPEVAQKVYNTVHTSLPYQVIEQRINTLYNLLGIPPEIEGREVTPKEYAKFLKVQDQKYYAKDGFIKTMHLEYFARDHQSKFLDDMSRVFSSASQNGSEYLVYRALRSLEVAVSGNIDIPQAIIDDIPKIIPKGIVRLLVGERKEMRDDSKYSRLLWSAETIFGGNTMYAELCRDAFADALKKGFLDTYNTYLAVEPQDRRKKQSNLRNARFRLGNLCMMAELVGIDLMNEPELAEYIDKIDSSSYRKALNRVY